MVVDVGRCWLVVVRFVSFRLVIVCCCLWLFVDGCLLLCVVRGCSLFVACFRESFVGV